MLFGLEIGEFEALNMNCLEALKWTHTDFVWVWKFRITLAFSHIKSEFLESKIAVCEDQLNDWIIKIIVSKLDLDST